MQEWSARVQATGPGPYDIDWADEVLEAEVLRDRGAVLSAGGREIGIRFNVWAADLDVAGREAMRVFREVLPDLLPVEIQVQTVEDLDRELEESNVPDLLGVSEVAAALGVSRQRVSELAESDDFPPPIARLKAGPIWQRSQISRFVGNWDRRPGPKPGARRRQAAA
jgi:hypothetical protein